MFYHNIDPVLLKLGFLEIRYYGVLWLIGFTAAYFLLKHLAKRKGLNLSSSDIDDLFLLLVISIVAGARLFYVLIYNFWAYLSDPLEIFAVWNGGLSFHGGFIGGVIALLFFCRKKKIDFFEIADIAVIPLAFGIFLGRMGNFINGELVGRITDMPWCVNFKGHTGCRHPSQLYESFKNLIIFSVLWMMKDKKMVKGFFLWLFIFMYGSLRFFIEFFREPDPQMGFILGLTMGQILSLVMIAIGGCGLVWCYRKVATSKLQK